MKKLLIIALLTIISLPVLARDKAEEVELPENWWVLADSCKNLTGEYAEILTITTGCDNDYHKAKDKAIKKAEDFTFKYLGPLGVGRDIGFSFDFFQVKKEYKNGKHYYHLAAKIAAHEVKRE